MSNTNRKENVVSKRGKIHALPATDVDQFATEVLSRGLGAALPQNLPDRWLRRLGRDIVISQKAILEGQQRRRVAVGAGEFGNHLREDARRMAGDRRRHPQGTQRPRRLAALALSRSMNLWPVPTGRLVAICRPLALKHRAPGERWQVQFRVHGGRRYTQLPLIGRGSGSRYDRNRKSGERMMAEKKVPYQVNGRQFEGMIVYDDSVQGKRPAIFMQPDWKGVDRDTIAQARTVAGKDYVVLMADMFGKGYGDKPKTRRSCGPA